jgi:gluconate 5-dehydrogenase
VKDPGPLFRLDGRLALVTGGSRGIGLGIARTMAGAGARVIVAARPGPELEAAAAELHAHAPIDLFQTEHIAGWYDELVARYGRPDVLVNAAGMTRRTPAEEIAMEEWNAILSLNLTSVFALSQAFARQLIAAGEPGKIVNIASLMTFAARRTVASYTASKGGIGQLTKALAVDWADKRIHVNAVAPGYIDTPLNAPLIQDAAFSSWVCQRTPLGRWGTPEDIGLAALFLASPAAGFITGQILYVDGGWTASF